MSYSHAANWAKELCSCDTGLLSSASASITVGVISTHCRLAWLLIKNRTDADQRQPISILPIHRAARCTAMLSH
jgi:hypothetical protein